MVVVVQLEVEVVDEVVEENVEVEVELEVYYFESSCCKNWVLF